MAGRMILFAVICFLLYWGWQYYKSTQTNKEKPHNPADFKDSDGDPDGDGDNDPDGDGDDDGDVDIGLNNGN